MLIDLKDLRGYAIRASDGDIGTVKDFYFDDEHWTIRYLVVEAGSWLSSRKVLVTPVALGEPNADDRVIPASVTQAQIRSSPDIDVDQPVSRQREADFLGHYGYPVYWGGAGLWGGEPFPGMLSGLGFVADPPLPVPDAATDDALSEANARRHAHDDPHLRSCEQVDGYHLKASDGEIGHVEGYLVEPRSWEIRWLIAATSNWGLGHKVLVSPRWISSVNWDEATVSVRLTQQSIAEAPRYEPGLPPTREQEEAIAAHFRTPLDR